MELIIGLILGVLICINFYILRQIRKTIRIVKKLKRRANDTDDSISDLLNMLVEGSDQTVFYSPSGSKQKRTDVN